MNHSDNQKPDKQSVASIVSDGRLQCIYKAVKTEVLQADKARRPLDGARQLARKHACSINTITTVMSLLKAEGLIKVRRGVGYLIASEAQQPGDELYEQIAQTIQTDCQKLKPKSRSRIPSIRALARQHQVSTNTIAKAMRLLTRQGVIAKRAGIGYFLTK